MVSNSETIDYGPLIRQVPISETIGEAKRILARSWWMVLIFVAIAGFVLMMILQVIMRLGGSPSTFAFTMSLVALVGAVWLLLRYARQILLLRSFAQANGFETIEQRAPDGYAGMIFDVGHSRAIQRGLRLGRTWLDELGNYKYVTGSGKNSQTHHFGYLIIRLPRRLPHMVLDSRDNNFLGLTNLPVSFGRDQRLSLEGDFDQYFTLYAPKQYETDALYIFTPDVMQALIDEGHKYDMEVIDDRLYVYTPARLQLTQPEALKRLFQMCERIGRQVNEQADYYADARIGDRSENVVAVEGERLKQSFPWIIAVIVAIILLFQAGPFIIQFLTVFMGR